HTRSKRDWSSDVCSSDLEVLGGDGVVRAVDRDDRLLGQIGIRVVLGDGRVVPAGDVAGEDAAQRLGGEVQLLDALEVEHHGDRGGRKSVGEGTRGWEPGS